MKTGLKASSPKKYASVEKNYWSLAGLLLGIFSFFLVWVTPFIPMFGLITSIVGITFSRRKQSGLATGIIGLVLSITVLSYISGSV
ncbi:hypothetical protein [Virgibacillus sp. SK37]|uniref:hypothetical protein n=2 Tax=Virgibacillus TaxID=84406 RepID=UPI0004D12DB5|nr:hypothetical protein [Virgibacillus sp. SK37]AIF45685.1 hypothetical protein X953_19150 [Virgibacillus sp. SK37]MYL59732.1 hypothetical protein [Virgibacillus halodenitrificans]